MNASTLRLTVLKAHRRAVGLLIFTTLCAFWVLLSPFAADHRVMDALAGILAVAFIPLCLERLALQPGRAAGAVWTAITLLMAVVAVHGFARFIAPLPEDAVLLVFLQVIALEVAFAAMLLHLLKLRAARTGYGSEPAALGDIARFLFVYGGYFDRLRYPDFKRRMFLPLARQIMFVNHLVRWLPSLAPHVRRLTGQSSLRQALDIAVLYFRHDLDATAYYMFERYRPGHAAETAGYLVRYETKNGIYYALNHLFQRRRPDGRSWLGDKIRFADLCAELGVRCVPILARIERGEVLWTEGVDRRLAADFFVKRRIGKGAYGAGLYHHLPGERHRTPSGAEHSTEAILADLAARSKQEQKPREAGEGTLLPAQERAANKGALLLQPRLRNHPEIADLAEDSLMVMRVITCLDVDRAEGEAGVVVGYAFLRILAMLEPRWPTKVEFGAPVDLKTGRLGLMIGDKGEMATRRFAQHPILPGIAIEGRVVPHFQEILHEAKAAHRGCGDRFLVGWDIAITPDGPLIVEGNAHPDIEFPQHVHGKPIGDSPIGPIIHRHLMRLERAKPLFDLARKL